MGDLPVGGRFGSADTERGGAGCRVQGSGRTDFHDEANRAFSCPFVESQTLISNEEETFQHLMGLALASLSPAAPAVQHNLCGGAALPSQRRSSSALLPTFDLGFGRGCERDGGTEVLG